MKFISGKQKHAIQDFSTNMCYSTTHSLLSNISQAAEQLRKIAEIVNFDKIAQLAAVIETCGLEIKDSLEREVLIPLQGEANEEECGDEGGDISQKVIVEAEEK